MAGSQATELAALVATAATAEEDVTALPDGDATVYAIGESMIVRVEGRTAEFRLRPDVAAAAARTPDASPSPRGPEWVAFSPTSFDRFTRDRIEAWFEFAIKQMRVSDLSSGY